MRRLFPMGLAVAVAILAGGSQARASVVFFDDFNSENGGVGQLNYTGFANWSVTSGAVDLIGNGFFDFYPGNGLFVDMDGSIGAVGTIESTALSLGTGAYELTFDLGGSQRGDTNTVRARVSSASAMFDVFVDITLNSSDPLAAQTLGFNVTTAASDYVISYASLDGSNNIGLILDNVKLSVVPEPSTVCLMGLGLAGLGLGAWRKRRAG